MLGKKSVIVIGGVDVAKIPEMNYGIWNSWWRSALVGSALRNASAVLAVDSSLKRKAIELAQYNGENILCVPTGYDAQVWFPVGPKEPFILSVAKCDDVWKMRVKGIDKLLECAHLLPTRKFIVVGLSHQLIQDLADHLPPNVELFPFCEQSELLRYYQRAGVYCQPSYSEGLPNSVCEAMLCQCIPVGTDVGGIPAAVGNCGFLVPYGDVGNLAAAIEQALGLPGDAGKQSRKHIQENFTLEKRETALLKVLTEPLP
jgi:glycosyltransferase involved in cell wall biosynthesis